MAKKRKRNKKIKKLMSVLAAVLIVAVVVCAAVIYLFSPVNATDEKVYIKVESGATLNEIADALKENDLIRNTTIFKVYVHLRGAQTNLKPGAILSIQIWAQRS